MKQNKLTLVNTVLLAIVIILQVVTMICFAPARNGSGATDGDGTGASQDVINIDVLKIDTPYATLQYPSKWLTYLKHKEAQTSTSYSLDFICHISGQDVELFTVHFGIPEKGQLMGYVEKNAAKVAFTIEKAEIKKADFSQADYDILSAMQKDADVLVKSVSLS